MCPCMHNLTELIQGTYEHSSYEYLDVLANSDVQIGKYWYMRENAYYWDTLTQNILSYVYYFIYWYDTWWTLVQFRRTDLCGSLWHPGTKLCAIDQLEGRLITNYRSWVVCRCLNFLHLVSPDCNHLSMNDFVGLYISSPLVHSWINVYGIKCLNWNHIVTYTQYKWYHGGLISNHIMSPWTSE